MSKYTEWKVGCTGEKKPDLSNLPASIPMPKEYDSDIDVERRGRLLGTKANTNDKMLFYNAGTNNELDKLITGLEKGLSISEECSAASYFWTCLHYACFYGHKEIINYILNYNKDDDEDYLERHNIQSNEGKTPLMLCLNTVKEEQRKIDILKSFYEHNAIDFGLCDYKGKNIFDYIKDNTGFYNDFLNIILEN